MTRDQKIAVAKIAVVTAVTIATHIGSRMIIAKTLRTAFPIDNNTSN